MGYGPMLPRGPANADTRFYLSRFGVRAVTPKFRDIPV